MNKKILVMLVALLVLSITLTPFAVAKPWNERNNEKFETFSTTVAFNFEPILTAIANPEYVPSQDHTNKIIYSWVEEATAYTITVDGVTYSLGTDFEYSGVSVVTTVGEPFTPNPLLAGMLVGSKETHFRVDYMYDFSAVEGGIEGTISMLALTTSGPDRLMYISSLQGTGDLKNVKIWATAAGMGHLGIVSGWPDTPPATP